MLINCIQYIMYSVIFPGDHPELQFESGNSHGGNYPCMCGAHVKRFNDLAYLFNRNIQSLEERRLKVNLVMLVKGSIIIFVTYKFLPQQLSDVCIHVRFTYILCEN